MGELKIREIINNTM